VIPKSLLFVRLLNKPHNDRAIADYNRAIELKPDHASAYNYRGLAYSAKGDNDQAIADYNRAAELFTDPGDREDTLREMQRLGAE
jgi:Flp pilus assembly protein TadD